MAGTKNLFDISGKVAVVTGAAGGLGNAIWHGLTDAGAKVIGADIREPTKKPSGDALFRLTDVSKRDEIRKLVGQACDQFGRIDIMIANAAIGGGARAEEEQRQDSIKSSGSTPKESCSVLPWKPPTG